MKSFIPHSNNPHRIRKNFGIFVIVACSIVVAYFGQSYFEKNSLAQETDIEVKHQVEEKKDVAGSEDSNNFQTIVQNNNENVFTVSDDAKVAMTQEEAKETVPAVRSEKPLERLREAQVFAKPQLREGKYIDVSLAYQNMVLFENGKFVDAYLISSGKRGMETPIGTFKIENKAPRAWSKTYGLYMPSWMAIEPNGKYGIHELPEWPGGYKEGENHLGVPVSHGCVRLGVGAAKRVFDWADIGTPVVIHK